MQLTYSKHLVMLSNLKHILLYAKYTINSKKSHGSGVTGPGFKQQVLCDNFSTPFVHAPQD